MINPHHHVYSFQDNHHIQAPEYSRVAKCHGYDGYFCANKMLTGWAINLWGHKILQNQASFQEDLYRYKKICAYKLRGRYKKTEKN